MRHPAGSGRFKSFAAHSGVNQDLKIVRLYHRFAEGFPRGRNRAVGKPVSGFPPAAFDNAG
jgi:hypothetical protein